MKNKNFKRFTLLGFDRSFSKGLGSQLAWLVGIMCVVYIVLTGISYVEDLYAGNGSENNRLLDILQVLIDPGSNVSMSSTLKITCALLGLIIFSGMLISVISNVLQRRVESYTKGETNYKTSNHVVVLGFNKSIPSLLTMIQEKHKGSMIILMSNRNCEEMRDWIHSHIKSDIEELLILLNGDRLAEEDLKRLNLNNNIKEIFLLGEEDEVAHDAINMECVKKMASLMPMNSKVECHVQIESHAMYSVLQAVDFNKTKLDDDSTISDHLLFIPFNFNEIWSQKVLATIPNPKDDYTPLDGKKGIQSDSLQHVHLIIVGMNEMGISLAINAAHLLHFPNYKDGVFSTYSQITFIDAEAESKGEAFRTQLRHLFDLARWRYIDSKDCMNEECGWIDPMADSNSPYSHLGNTNFMDIQWEFIKGDLYNCDIQDYLSNCSIHDKEITTIALCDNDSEKNATFCMALPESICKSANTILVRQKEGSITIDLIRKLHEHDKIRSFGMMTECYQENLISDKYGKIINACYRGLNITLQTVEDETIQEEIEREWDKCHIRDKWSSNYCANMLMTKLRSLGFDIDGNIDENEIESKISQSDIKDEIQRTEHNRWNTEKLLVGVAPLLKQESEEFKHLQELQDLQELKDKKRCWYLKRNKHLDICSNDKLKVIDPSVAGYDNRVNSKLWILYQMVKKQNQ